MIIDRSGVVDAVEQGPGGSRPALSKIMKMIRERIGEEVLGRE
jgi:hypothetical protein